jgi:hypothetical protein
MVHAAEIVSKINDVCREGDYSSAREFTYRAAATDCWCTDVANGGLYTSCQGTIHGVLMNLGTAPGTNRPTSGDAGFYKKSATALPVLPLLGAAARGLSTLFPSMMSLLISRNNSRKGTLITKAIALITKAVALELCKVAYRVQELANSSALTVTDGLQLQCIPVLSCCLIYHQHLHFLLLFSPLPYQPFTGIHQSRKSH